MNAPVDVMERRTDADARLGIIDCDIHPYLKPGALNQIPVGALAQARGGIRQVQLRHLCRSRHLSSIFSRIRRGGIRGRRAAGCRAPMSLFMREQLLDPYNISYGVLEPLLGGNTSRNLDEAAALCSAMNDWQAHDFVDQEPRLRASILVPQDDPRRR